MRVWMTWSQRTYGWRVTKEQFQAQLAKYPKTSILVECTKLSVGLGYGPDACTVPPIMSQTYTFRLCSRPAYFLMPTSGFTKRNGFRFSMDNCVPLPPRQFGCRW